MSHLDTIRAWKDAAYRASLSEEERNRLPANPAGEIELTDADLGDVAGSAPKTFNLNCIKTYDVSCYTNSCPTTTVSYCGACF